MTRSRYLLLTTGTVAVTVAAYGLAAPPVAAENGSAQVSVAARDSRATQPKGVTAKAGNRKMTISWKLKGKGKIKKAVATARPVGGKKSAGSCSPRSVLGKTGTKCSITKLKNGLAYLPGVRVRKANGKWSKTITAKNPVVVESGPPFVNLNSVVGPIPSPDVSILQLPGAPQSVSGTAGNSQVTALWHTPQQSGTSPITGYAASAKSLDPKLPGGSCSAAAVDQACSITGLVNGVKYQVLVQAFNESGGGPSGASPSATMPTGPPVGVPTPRLRILDEQNVIVTWDKPQTNGGQPIESYLVTGTQISPNPGVGNIQCSPKKLALRACSFKSLPLDSVWEFALTAANALGATSSDPTGALTIGAPTHQNRPRHVRVAAVITKQAAGKVPALYSLQASWTKPTGGAPVDHYVVTPWSAKLVKGPGLKGWLHPKITFVKGAAYIAPASASTYIFPQPNTLLPGRGGPFTVTVRAFGAVEKSVPVPAKNIAGLPGVPNKPLFAQPLQMTTNVTAFIMNNLPSSYGAIKRTAIRTGLATAAYAVFMLPPLLTPGGLLGVVGKPPYRPGQISGTSGTSFDVTDPNNITLINTSYYPPKVPQIIEIPRKKLPLDTLLDKLKVSDAVKAALLKSKLYKKIKTIQPFIGLSAFSTNGTYPTGNQFTFQVNYTNAYGQGAVFTTKPTKGGQTRPSQPTNLNVAVPTKGSAPGTATVTFKDGGVVKGDPTTSYKVTAKPDPNAKNNPAIGNPVTTCTINLLSSPPPHSHPTGHIRAISVAWC